MAEDEARSEETPSAGEHRCRVIAEVGGGHFGDMNIAKDYIDNCADAGVDVVKFQTHPKDDHRPKFEPDEWVQIKEYCDECGVEFLSTPFDLRAVDILNPLVKRWKVASGHVTNLALLRRLAETGKQVLLSTGMSSTSEIRDAMRVLEDVPVVPMSCVSMYPTPPEYNVPYDAVGASQIDEFEDGISTRRTWWGFSDHSRSVGPSIVAAWIGARYVEVHIELDNINLYLMNNRDLVNPDSAVCLKMWELCSMVEAIRYVERMPGFISKDELLDKLVDVRRKYLVRSE